MSARIIHGVCPQCGQYVRLGLVDGGLSLEEEAIRRNLAPLGSFRNQLCPVCRSDKAKLRWFVPTAEEQALADTQITERWRRNLPEPRLFMPVRLTWRQRFEARWRRVRRHFMRN